MKAADLNLRDLLEFEPNGGLIRFAGTRTLLLDAVALGLLREQLVRTFGVLMARGLLTRFGFAHGWRVAEALEHALPWDDVQEWQRAGGRIHRLKGLVTFEPVVPRPTGPDAPLAVAVWPDSYEADQHLDRLGRSEKPACWSLLGFASGYLSRAYGKDVRCLELKCRACGDAVCRMEGREASDWPEGTDLSMYEEEALEGLRDTLRSPTAAPAERRRPVSAEDHAEEGHGLIVRSSAMRMVLTLARKVARVDTTVLVTGESGTGKERIARFVHDESARQARPFLAVNCGALPESLLESELFGHVRGAFTGADRDREGLFEAARGGTLLLDEIGEVPQAMQVKLLRVLQEREVRRVGESESRAVDVRIIAATHRNLEDEVEAGRFREDLLYRLRVVSIELPPLRERRDDILPLARALLDRLRARFAQDTARLGNAACQALLAHEWPGNVRELENAMERALVMTDSGVIEPEDLGITRPRPEASPDPHRSEHAPLAPLAEIERAHIERVLEAHAGHRRKAAQVLGIGEATLYRKLKSWK